MAKFTVFVSGVAEVVDETHDTKTLKFHRPQGLDFKPGQFLTMQFIGKDGLPEKKIRSFTIASSPEDEMIDITVKREGEMSNRMCDAEIGAKFRFSGPFGAFFLIEDDAKHHAMICGGSGVTPFRSFMRHVNQKKLGHKMTLFYSNKTPVDIIYREELEKLSAENPNIRNVLTITREEGHKWDSLTGRINKQVLLQYIPDIQNTIFYTCGPKGLINTVLDILKELGVKPENIKTERWN
ncbi:MAG: oxidoreductase FAD/NAD(P)-binding component [archaeon GW2011_AR3]|nr:MAG: oxidoreductase FAD/NAD(P)-binding component [archaeon GW2011_AR3]MBS3109019.1 FAD-dependent oxidoreductase [Candidatus Woesearchaeota archaeon]